MGQRILVVDDDPSIAGLVADLLVNEGYEVQTAGDGEAALDVIARDPPDLIISDVTMPRRDGLSLLRTLRRRHVAIPIVLMTALPLSARLTGVPILQKPFDLETLLTFVAWALTGARPRRRRKDERRAS